MYRRRRTRAGIVVLSALLALGMAGCGGDDDDDDEAEATTTTERETGEATVDVEMKDYAFAVGGALTEGGTIRLRNTGKEFHMMGMGKLKAGKGFEDVRATVEKASAEFGGEEGEGEEEPTTTAAAGAATTLPGEEEDGEEEEPFAHEILEREQGAPAGFVGPGQVAEVTVPDLGAGDYALFCFLPTEGGGPPHVVQGMYGVLEVVGGTAPTLTPTATYKIESGKAIQGPSTLPAGKAILKIEGVGDVSDLEPSLVKPTAGKTIADMDKAFDALEEEFPKGAASRVPGAVVVSLHDLEEATTVYLGVDLTPGTYQLTAQDSDVEDAPALPKELITIRVT